MTLCIPSGQSKEFYDAAECLNQHKNATPRELQALVNECCKLCDKSRCGSNCRIYAIGESGGDTYSTNLTVGGKSIYHVGTKYYYGPHQGD